MIKHLPLCIREDTYRYMVQIEFGAFCVYYIQIDDIALCKLFTNNVNI